MNLKPLGANKTELELSDGTKVLFSYRTPVAARKITCEGAVFYVTSETYSKTTTKHIRSWCPIQYAEIVSQEFLDGLVK